ncbi:MAG: carbamoyl-phosphate synthase large subunit, partial [Sphingomonadales bacterium]|nr:carbamoyl-phosphate synthase large subunit [Sphingomonadales bacterium]
TVSTDYDTSDRLYFEPLTLEDVLHIVETERPEAVIVQFGGQTPLKLAKRLEEAGIPILGTTPDAIDLAEDRERFQVLLDELKLLQPKNGIARSLEEAQAAAEDIGFPVLIRPSYVLGGRAMEIVHDMEGLNRYMAEAVKVSGESPVLIDSYLQGAIEVDVDALSDGTDVFVAGIMEHIEEAGIHSGDSTCSLPPHSLSAETIAGLKKQTVELALALNVVGLMNVQYAVKDGDIYLIEVNPRASRTVPFVAKAVGIPVAKIAARLMAGEKLKDFNLKSTENGHVAVKAPVFPFARFPGVDVLLGPEMKSTGEVMGIDKDFETAFAKSQMGAGITLPLEGTVFVSVKNEDKTVIEGPCRQLVEMGYKILATKGTADHLFAHGIPATPIFKVAEGRPHVVDAMKNGEVDLVINTTEGKLAISDSYQIRRTALMEKIPYYTTMAAAKVVVKALKTLKAGNLEVLSIQHYSKGA